MITSVPSTVWIVVISAISSLEGGRKKKALLQRVVAG